jgi:hypothetical protein
MDSLEEFKIKIIQEDKENKIYNNENSTYENFYFVIITMLTIIRFFSFLYFSI